MRRLRVRQAVCCFADERAPERRCQVETLLGVADVLVTGYRPGALAAHWLDAQSVQVARPNWWRSRSLSWGAAGPWTERRGFDSIVQAATGVSEAYASRAASGPGALSVQTLDYGGGHLTAAAARNLLARRTTRDRHAARISLAGADHWLLTHQLGWLDQPPPGTGTDLEFVGATASPYGDLTDVLPALIRDGNAPDCRSAPQIYGEAPLAWLGSQVDSLPDPGRGRVVSAGRLRPPPYLSGVCGGRATRSAMNRRRA